MRDKTSNIFFALFFIGIVLIVLGNILGYYFSASIIGNLFNGIGIVLWIILIILKFVLEKRK
jgi:hypothetical protein